MYLVSLIPILSFLGFTFTFSKYSNFSLRNSFPITLSLLVIVLYLFAMIGIVFYATILLYLLGFGSLVFLHRKKKEFLNSILSDKLRILAYIALIMLFGFFYKEAFLSCHDDFTFWGISTKELLFRHKFEATGDLTSIMSMHAHYARGADIYHYFFLLPTGFSEGAALFAHFLLYLVLLIPICETKKISNTFLSLLIVSSILMLYSSAFRSLYLDSIMGLFFANCIITYFSENHNKRVLFFIMPLFAAMPLFKEIGLILAIISAVIINVDYYSKNNAIKFENLALVSLPIIVSIILGIYFNYTHDFFGRTSHSFSNIYEKLLGSDHPVISLIFEFLFKLIKSLFKESLIITYLTIFGAWYYTEQDKKTNKRFVFTIKTLSIALIFFILWRLYIFIFIHSDMSSGSMTRYLGSFMIAPFVISFMYLRDKFYTKDLSKTKTIGLYLVYSLAVIIFFQNIARVQNKLSLNEKLFNTQAEDISNLLAKKTPIEFDFSNKSSRQECHEIAFKLAPYFKEAELQKCLKEPINHLVIYSSKLSIAPKEIENNCKLIYKPFLFEIKVHCEG